MKETVAYQLAEGYYDPYAYIFYEVTEEILRDFFCSTNTDKSFYESVGLGYMDDEDYVINVCLIKGEKGYTLIVTDNTGDTKDYELLPVKLIGE